MIDELTLILPIRERVQYIPRFMKFHSNFRILVVDSSVNRNDSLFIGASNVDYYWFGPIKHFEKISKALDLASTKYVLLATDDDFFVEGGIRDCIRILETEPTAICAHGANVNFEEEPTPNIFHHNSKTILRNLTCPRRPVLSTIRERLAVTFVYGSYSPYNATFRRADLQHVIKLMLKYGFDKPGANDYGFSFVVATMGDYLSSRKLYCLKCIDAPSVRTILKIPMVDFWRQLEETAPLWAERCDPGEILPFITEWKARISARARMEGLLGRLSTRVFKLGGYRLLKPYREAALLLDKAMGHA